MPAATPRPPYQIKIGQWIVNAEARRDPKGRMAIYKLPAGDGGGTFEIAGINDRYHPRTADYLHDLIMAGKHEVAENLAIEYICSYTDVVCPWSRWTCVEAFLRDCAFNRGPGGAAKILQIALDVTVDGHVGPKTLSTCNAEDDRRALLKRLREAREIYERRIAPPVGSRAKFWKGLVNRWNKALTFAESLA